MSTCDSHVNRERSSPGARPGWRSLAVCGTLAYSQPMKVVSKEVLVPSPGPGVGVAGGAYYTRAAGHELVSVHSHHSRSDTADIALYRRSADGGATWGPVTEVATGEQRDGGMWRRYPRAGHADPATDRYVTVRVEGVLPTDEPLEGMRQWLLHYAVSADGGRTDLIDEPVVHDGSDEDGVPFDADHPLPGVWRGRNGVMLGDLTCLPLTLRGRKRCRRHPGAVPDLPGGAGRHLPQQGGRLHVPRLGGPARALGGRRASSELAIVRARDRRSGAVHARVPGGDHRRARAGPRADGDARLQRRAAGAAGLPLVRHVRGLRLDVQRGAAVEADTSGAPLHSPSACSQLLDHSDGRLFWLGNLCEGNPRGNSPRYPIVIAEVERDTGLVMREPRSPIIDDRQPGEFETAHAVQLLRPRGTGQRATSCSICRATTARERTPSTADNMVYRIAVD